VLAISEVLTDPVIVAALLGVAGVGVTAIVTYVVARRTTSGRVETSEAATLWAASEQMRKELRDELVAARAQVIELLRQNESLHRQITELLEEIDRLQKRLAAYQGMSRG